MWLLLLPSQQDTNDRPISTDDRPAYAKVTDDSKMGRDRSQTSLQRPTSPSERSARQCWVRTSDVKNIAFAGVESPKGGAGAKTHGKRGRKIARSGARAKLERKGCAADASYY